METVNSLPLGKGREHLMVPRRNVFVEGVLLRDVPVLLRREEYVSNMAQSKRSTLVVMKDEQTKFRKEECANDMVQRLRLVVMMDVRTKLSKEGYASSTVQRLRLAVMKDVPTKLSKEEFVSNMVQRGTLAVMKDVPTKL